MKETDLQPDFARRDPGFARLILAVLAAWTIFGIIAFVQFYSSMEGDRHTMPLGRSLELGLGNAWLKAVLSLPVLWALLRLNARPRKFWVQALAHLGLLVAFTAVHIVIRPYLIPVWMMGGGEVHYTFGEYLPGALRSFTLDDALAFSLTAVAFYVWRYGRESRLRTLREQALRAQLANAELSLLKMQLQPHFLFNTLNTIHCLAPENSRKAQQMIEQLSRLLRLSLDHLSSNVVPLSTELEFLDAYLDIESTRFDERLRVVRDIDPAALEAQVPSMILQPLVENAIRHGVGRLAGGGAVQISARREADRLAIRISNDYRPASGTGISRSTGLGLANTRARLMQMFGNDFRFQLDRNNDRATVTIEAPFRSIAEESVVQEEAWTK